MTGAQARRVGRLGHRGAHLYYNTNEQGDGTHIALGAGNFLLAAAGASTWPSKPYDYNPFGKPTIYHNAGATLTTSRIGTPYLFQGRRYDPAPAPLWP